MPTEITPAPVTTVSFFEIKSALIAELAGNDNKYEITPAECDRLICAEAEQKYALARAKSLRQLSVTAYLSNHPVGLL
jgi:hypothetical protein